jgi:hypothetical protein
MENQITLDNGITYAIKSEASILEYENIQKACNGYYVSILVLKRPKGHKEFDAMRDKFGRVTLVRSL